MGKTEFVIYKEDIRFDHKHRKEITDGCLAGSTIGGVFGHDHDPNIVGRFNSEKEARAALKGYSSDINFVSGRYCYTEYWIEALEYDKDGNLIFWSDPLEHTPKKDVILPVNGKIIRFDEVVSKLDPILLQEVKYEVYPSEELQEIIELYEDLFVDSHEDLSYEEFEEFLVNNEKAIECEPAHSHPKRTK